MQHHVFRQPIQHQPATHCSRCLIHPPPPPHTHPTPSPDMLVIFPLNVSSLLHPLRHPHWLAQQLGRVTWWLSRWMGRSRTAFRTATLFFLTCVLNLQTHLSLINNLWGGRKPRWKANSMTTAEVFQRLFHLCEPETTGFKGNPSSANYSAELGMKLFGVCQSPLRINQNKVEISHRWWAWKQQIIKSLILKLKSVWWKRRRVFNLFLLSLPCDMKDWSRGALLALMSGPDCRGVLVLINSCLLNF